LEVVAVQHLDRDVEVGCQGPAEDDLDEVTAAGRAGPGDLDASDRASRDVATDDLDPLVRVGEAHVVADLVEGDVEELGDEVEGVLELEDPSSEVLRMVGVASGAPPPEVVLVRLERHQGQVVRLDHPDEFDVAAGARCGGHEVLRVAGVDARAEDACASLDGRLPQPLHLGGVEGPTGDELRRRDDVDTGPEQPGHLAEIRGQGKVAHAVGPELDDRVDVVRREHAELPIHAGELAGVDAHLVGAVSEQAHQLHVGASIDLTHHLTADVSGRPLHDLERHRCRTPGHSRVRSTASLIAMRSP
jgi:hypothetical protein